LSAKETALSETPARRAMSFMVGRRAGERLAGMVPLISTAVIAKALECLHPKAL
jgi:hypothetical protein